MDRSAELVGYASNPIENQTMNIVLRKFSMANLANKSKDSEKKSDENAKNSNSIKSRFSRSLDSLTNKVKGTFSKNSRKKSEGNIEHSAKNGDNSLSTFNVSAWIKNPNSKRLGPKDVYNSTKLDLNEEISSPTSYSPVIQPVIHSKQSNTSKPSKSLKQNNKPNEFLITQQAASQKPKPIDAIDSSKTLSPGSSFRDIDSPRISLKEVKSPSPPTSDLKPETPESRQKSLASLVNGTTKLSPHFTTRYVLGEMLGDGAFGFVFTAKRISDSVEVAVKFIIRTKITKDNWVDHGLGQIPCEIDTLQKLNHPNIIKYIEHIIEDEYVLLITELFGTSWDASNLELDPANNPGLKFRFHRNIEDTGKTVIKSRTSCDLFECIDAHTRIPISKAKFLFAQIVLACDYLQSMNLVHRDIKDENIVVNSKYEIKLIDFGSASSIPTRHQDYFTRYNGTPHFAAPEIAAGNTYQGPQAEVWTLGVLLYTIIFGENPFQDKADILRYNGTLTYPRFIETDLQKLIEQMLCINVRRRITLENIKSHPWCAFQISSLKKQYEERECQLA